MLVMDLEQLESLTVRHDADGFLATVMFAGFDIRGPRIEYECAGRSVSFSLAYEQGFTIRCGPGVFATIVNFGRKQANKNKFGVEAPLSVLILRDSAIQRGPRPRAEVVA